MKPKRFPTQAHLKKKINKILRQHFCRQNDSNVAFCTFHYTFKVKCPVVALKARLDLSETDEHALLRLK